MKNKIISTLAITAVFAGIVSNVQAIPVTGTVQMSGQVNFNTSSLLTATSATFPEAIDATVTSGSGSYSAAGVNGSAVTWNSFTFSSTGPQVVAPLWSFVNLANTWTYTFNLASISSIDRSTVGGIDDLVIRGTGTVNIVGALSPYDLTYANWSFTVSDTSGGGSGLFQFGFSDSNTASDRVPDGGTTMMLLGAGLSGLGLLRKKLVA